MSDLDPSTAALADLGARVLALVVSSQRLGHETHAMTAHYLHDQDVTGRLVIAVARGRARNSDAALVEWLDSKGLDIPDFIRPEQRSA